MRNARSLPGLLGLALLLATAGPSAAAEVKLLLPLGRTAYQTNEWIDISVVRSAAQALDRSELKLTLAGKDGSRVFTTFAVAAVPVRGKEARTTEHLHVNGALLRPGTYSVEASCDGATAKTDIEVHSHLRQSSFRLVNWGRAGKEAEQRVQGEDSLGFNLFYGHYGNDDQAHFLRAGVDFIANCVMSGAHQMDIRMECDWSDPYVTRGGTMRVVRRAMIDRSRPNVPGVHFYDEPGLTWRFTDASRKEMTPHEIPAQVRSYVAAFDREPIPSNKIDPKNPEHVRQWNHWARWKLGLMDAAWKEAQFGVSQVRPDFLSLTQSQYGWSAFTDGYYFNVVRSLPITSGHGGYHDFGLGYFNPSYFLEMARARDHTKPCWYLPTWYGNTTADQFRMEQYLSFQTNIQGMLSPPDLEPATNAGGRQGIVESNQLMKKLGPIFTTLPVTKPPVALLYSLSQAIHTQTKDRSANYAHAIPHGQNLPLVYLAGKLLGQQFLPVVEEDILDGTLANDHKAIVLTSLDYLDAKVIAALEDFARDGGLVLMTADCTVKVTGAVKLPVKPAMPDQEIIDRLVKEKKYNEARPYTTTAKHIEGATPLAKALKAELEKAKFGPVFECNVPTISATRQAAGDIEYLFAVNATGDPANTKDILALRATEATITLPADGGPVYDAVAGGTIEEFKANGKKLSGTFRFGPGQMRVFARTARPIGGVRVATPVLTRDLVQESPIRLEVSVTLVDDKGRTLSGSAPLHVKVIDPLGVTRHELYRATSLGNFQVSLPLAANDPSGEWKIVVRELLNNGEDSVSFSYKAPKRARSIAGATPRAVSFGNDRDNIFLFVRTHRAVTIVKGTSAFHDAAVKRLKKVLDPWGVECKEMSLAEASKSRVLTEEEAKTWCGLVYAGSGQIKPGGGNPPSLAGFAVKGPVILLGTPEDNPIIKFLLTERFLPYRPDAADFPGVGRGMIAWQRDGVGRGQESVTLIAYDAEGMSEAVGSFYEAAAGLEPLTKWKLPESDTLTPAKTAPGLAPAAAVAWSVKLPDRVVAIKANADGLQALTHDNSLATITTMGKISGRQALSAEKVEQARKDLTPAEDKVAVAAAKKQERPDRIVKLSASGSGKVAVAYWGGTLRVVDGDGTIKAEQQLPQDMTALAWSGGKLIAGLADGRVLALTVKE
ncbi:MAG TPA: hypothetical protein VKD72_05595 [Gemmataceae bacterium]|nr:hypothetical protein [Gemmataceae bacterium]